ncbi:MAG: 3-isopropylmalate dehydratase large subunit [Thermodesulfobacteriota bacterium]
MTRPMCITEKILAAHAGREAVYPGELVQVRVDVALANDITAPLAIGVFREIGAGRVFDPERVVLVADHFVPNKDIASAEQVKVVRDFAAEQGIRHFYDPGNGGVEHVILPDMGLVGPGDLVLGADSHTCTYGALGAFSAGVGSTDLGAVMAAGSTWLKVPPVVRVVYEGELRPWVGGKDLILYTLGKIGVEGAGYKTLEFTGGTIERLPMSDRFTMANMAVEGGAKNGIVPPDETTRAYTAGRTLREPVFFSSDPGAEVERELHVDVSAVELQVAFPHSPDNVRPASAAGKVSVDQVFIGSCTNGRLEDLRLAAALLKGHKVHPHTRVIILPGSRDIALEALREGLTEVFLDAGAVVGPPSCGPCLGGHLGILAGGERAVSTSNRNFIGRMGHPESEVYLAGPAVAAASAVLGRIASPSDL